MGRLVRNARFGMSSVLAVSVLACAPAPVATSVGTAVKGTPAAAPAQPAAVAPATRKGPKLPAGAELIPPEPGDDDFETEPEAARPAPTPLKNPPRLLTADEMAKLAEARRLIEATDGQSRFWAIQGDYNGDYSVQFSKQAISAVLTPGGSLPTFAAALVFQPDADEETGEAPDEIVMAVGRGLSQTANGEQVCDWYWTSGYTFTGKARQAPWPKRYKKNAFEKVYRDILSAYYSNTTIVIPDPFNRTQLKNFLLAPNAYSTRVVYNTNPYELADGGWTDPDTPVDPKLEGDFKWLRKAFTEKYTKKTMADSTVREFQRVSWDLQMRNFGPVRSLLLNPTGGSTGVTSDNVWPNRWPKSTYTVRRSRPAMRAASTPFLEAVDTGALRLPAHLPAREIVDYDFQGEGLDEGAFVDLGGGRVKYTVPDRRMLVLNHFRRAIEVNGIELRPASDSTHHGGSFLFGSGEVIEFTLSGTNEISGFTLDPQLVSILGAK